MTSVPWDRKVQSWAGSADRADWYVSAAVYKVGWFSVVAAYRGQ